MSTYGKNAEVHVNKKCEDGMKKVLPNLSLVISLLTSIREISCSVQRSVKDFQKLETYPWSKMNRSSF